MNKKHDRSTAKFFNVIALGLVILALQVNTIKAQVSFKTNGQSIQVTNSWDIKLVDINGDGNLDAYFASKTWLNNGSGIFSETKLSFGSGIFASFGDLNGDGFVDAVCQDSIYLNDGNNHYEFRIKLSSDISMYSSVLSDVDNDGDIDIISCSTTTDRILFNDGKANFTNSGISLGGWGQASYTFGDINKDGFTDIYVAIPHTPPPTMKHAENKIWFGSAENKFTERSHDIAGAVSRNATLCDFDNDGDLDLFLASNGNTGNMIFFNDEKGNFTDSGQVLGNNSNTAKTADFDGDGDFDLFICYGKVPMGNGVPNKVWINDGKGHFTDNGLSLGNSNSAAIALGDINKDGKTDALIVNVKLDAENNYTSAPCPVEIWLNNAIESKMITAQHQQIFSQQQTITKGRVWDVAFEDLNNDGFSDMAIADWFKPPAIFYNDRNGSFENFKSLSSHEPNDSSYRVHGIGINEFNGDNNPDIFAVFNGLNNLLFLNEDGEFILADTINTNNSDGLNVSLGDMDNDKDTDFIVTNYNQPTTFWINNGEGKFTKGDSVFGSTSMFNVALGDVNNDGNLDVICSVYRQVIVWLNDGNGTFEKSILSIANEKGYGTIQVDDLDNDNDLDIIFSNNELGTSILLNDGLGLFSEIDLKLSSCIHLALGDIDLNGHIDIVCGNTIWLNSGNLQFNEFKAFELEGRIFGLWLNDIDNDLDLDLFYSSSIPEKGLVYLRNNTKVN